MGGYPTKSKIMKNINKVDIGFSKWRKINVQKKIYGKEI